MRRGDGSVRPTAPQRPSRRVWTHQDGTSPRPPGLCETDPWTRPETPVRDTKCRRSQSRRSAAAFRRASTRANQGCIVRNKANLADGIAVSGSSGGIGPALGHRAAPNKPNLAIVPLGQARSAVMCNVGRYGPPNLATWMVPLAVKARPECSMPLTSTGNSP